jgi:hypothetical protein
VKVFINKVSGLMAEIPPNGKMGKCGDKLKDHPDCDIVSISNPKEYHFKLGHCKYIDGKITIMAEEYWPENQEVL